MTNRKEQLQAAAKQLKPERRYLASDLIAALTFAVVNVPQAMAHALLATVNPVLGIYTLDGRRARRRHLQQLGLHERVQHRRAVGGRRRRADRISCRPEGAGARRAGDSGGRDPVAGGPVPAGFHDPLRLQCGDDRLSQWRGRADHPRSVERPDGLPEQVLEPGGPGVRSSLADRPDRPAGDDHRRIDAGVDRRAVAAEAPAEVRLHHRHCRGDRPAGTPDPSVPAHGRELRHGSDGR